MLPIDRQRELQKQKELNDNARAQVDADHIKRPTRSSFAYANEVFISKEGGGSGSMLSGGSFEPLITKTDGYAKYLTSTGWYFIDETYSLITHNHDTIYAPLIHNTSWTSVINRPTTINGYGITDAFDGQWTSILNHPTTISGYEITDAFDGLYSSLQGLPTLVNIYDTPTSGQLTTWMNATTIMGSPYMQYAGGGLSIVGNVNMTGTFTIGSDPGNNLWQYMPVSSTIHDSDILQWTSNKYAPWDVINKSSGRLYSGAGDPIGTTRLNYDGYLYATKFYSQYLSSVDGSLSHLTISSGNASGAAGTDAGDIIIKAGDAIFGDLSGSQGGSISLIPGNPSATGSGNIYLGSNTSKFSQISMVVRGTATNMHLVIAQKGTGYFQMGNSTGLTILRGNDVEVQANRLNVGYPNGSAVRIKGYYSLINANAQNTSVEGADAYYGTGASGNWNGGDLYLLGGQPYGTGTHGNIFLGTGSAGTAPLVGTGTGTSIIAYNRSTGQITYVDMNAAGITPVDNILDWDAGNSWYAPYAAKSAGKFDVGSVNPSSSNRLNYDGVLYATSLYAMQAMQVSVTPGGGTGVGVGTSSILMSITGTGRALFTPNVANSSSAVAYFIDTANDLSAIGAKLFEVRNYNIPKFQVLNQQSYSARNIVKDYDGNEYHTVIIGDQEWTVENLRVTHDDAGNTLPCISGYDDWYLPSYGDLYEMYAILVVGLGVGNFITNLSYWSSSEVSATNAYSVSFIDGSSTSTDKNTNFYIRACRSFTTSTTYTIGDRGPAGGWVFYKSGNNYLECAPNDNGNTYAWSNIIDSAVTGTITTIGAGQANTTLIIAQVSHTSSAASYCDALTSNVLWSQDTLGAYCYYGNDVANIPIYGLLYNWNVWDNYALVYFEKANIVDTGWRLPKDNDFNKLIEFLGGIAIAGGRMKEMGLAHWTTPNIDAINSSGFTALPGGYRQSVGSYEYINSYLFAWSQELGSWYCYHNDSTAGKDTVLDAKCGLSIRCVRDVSTKVVATGTPVFDDPLILDATVTKNFVCGTITGNTTITLQNTSDGDHGIVRLTIDGTGGYTIGLSGFGSLIFDADAYKYTILNSAGAATLIEYWNINGEIIHKVNYYD